MQVDRYSKQRLPATLLLVNIFLLAFLLSLFGIFTRPLGSLSLFWPVNAILLGLMLRKPGYATPVGWSATYLGMIAADLTAGEGWQLALWLNACNMALIATGYIVMQMLPKSQRRMRKPQAILYMFTACLLGAAVSATLSILRSDSLFNNTAAIAWASWFSEQFSTNLLILPIILAAPRLKQLLRLQFDWRWRACIPLLGLLLSLVLSVHIGGPGAIAFPIPALLWCAVRYHQFTVALLALVVGVTEIVSISANLKLYEAGGLHGTIMDTLMSARLGIAMLVMGPLILSSSISVNRKLLRRLEHSANHDFLTGALARSAITRQAREILERKHQSKEALSLLLIDIDHFKLVNDTYGHVIGDQVLAAFSHILRRELHHDQLFGRLGGEEFAIIMPRALGAQALALGEYLRKRVENADLTPTGKSPLRLTISVGVASLAMNEEKSLEQLMSMADIALYRAKSQGRNRVESFNMVSGKSLNHVIFE